MSVSTVIRSRIASTPRAASILLFLGSLSLPTPALAHVKWFCTCDVHQTPKALSAIIGDSGFLTLLVLALAVMAAVAPIDNWLSRQRFSRQLDNTLTQTGGWQPWLLRIATAVFFISLSLLPKGVLLTPELDSALGTESTVIRVVQFCIGLCMIRREAMAVAGVGIIALYAYAMTRYGVFHLLDYTCFPAIALALIVLSQDRNGWVPAVTLIRIGVAATLMWGGLEKFVFPQWYYTFLGVGGNMRLTMGLDPVFFVAASGFVEFSCAFLLLAGRLSAKVCALILTAVMSAVIPMFGMIDGVGHLLMIVSLILCATSVNALPALVFRTARPLRFMPLPLTYLAAIALGITSYEQLHAVLVHSI